MVELVHPPAADAAGRRGSNENGPPMVDVAGLGTATGNYWISSDVLAGILRSVWPGLDARIANLLRESPSEGRFVSRPPEELAQALSITGQMSLYAGVALDLAERAARRALDEADCDPASIGALIVVSCTGFLLPGLDARLVPILRLRRDVVRMPFTQLGCAGGAAGLARGAEWVRGQAAGRALVVAVEVCSLTFRPADRSVDNLLSALVFSDGAGAAVLENTGTTRSSRGRLRIGRSRGVLVEDSADALGFDLVDDGFRVVLSRRLPQLIEVSLPGVVRDFLGGRPVSALDVVAAHPGGSAILGAVQRCLGLSPRHLAASVATFRAVGNSSSAALLFVLAEVAGSAPRPGGNILGLAFGPGLAIELLELTWAE